MEDQTRILDCLDFSVGNLPVRYLGVPLIAKRLYVKDCGMLIEKVKGRVSDWKNKSLSYAGRVQLDKAVLTSMAVYWSSCFILPAEVSAEIESIIRGFLWSHGKLKKGTARVSWDEVCLPKEQGGINIPSFKTRNLALMSKHLWNVLTDKQSLWVSWVQMYKLKGESIWNIHENNEDSWSWKMILRCREEIKPHCKMKIGNGAKCLAWVDEWHPKGILSNHISRRDIKSAGFNMKTKVNEIRRNGVWLLPTEWSTKYPWLFDFNMTDGNSNERDEWQWRNNMGILGNFSVKDVYADIRIQTTKVPWFDFVWFSQCIPRHTFVTWLAFKFRLLTHDRMYKWDNNGDLKCTLCKSCPDSHNHLFFECVYSYKIWHVIKRLACWDNAPDCWNDIVTEAGMLKKGKNIWNVIRRLCVAAAVYFVWQERNKRFFEGQERNEDTIIHMIKHNVRCRLLGLRIKDGIDKYKAAAIWELPNGRITSGNYGY